MAVAAFSSFCLGECFHFYELCRLVSCYDHLRYPLPVVYSEILVREVYEHHAYLSSIVSVDGAWRVEHCYSVLQCQSAAWSHLCLVAWW